MCSISSKIWSVFPKNGFFFQNLIYFFKNQSILPDSDPFFKNLAIPLLLSYLFFQNLIRFFKRLINSLKIWSIHPNSDQFFQNLICFFLKQIRLSKIQSILPKTDTYLPKKSIVLKTGPCSKIWWACSKNWSILWREKSLSKKSAWNIKI